MNKRFLAVLLILIPIVAASACIGGDENIDNWNEIVQTANAHADDAGDYISDAEAAYGNGNYLVALNKADDAASEMSKLSNELDDLMDVADEMDNGFTVDYVEAWQAKVDAGQSYTANLKMLIHIDMFDEAYQQVLVEQDMAFAQMLDFMDYYNSDSYQMALTAGNYSMSGFQTIIGFADKMLESAGNIGVDYVIQYANVGKTLFENYQSFVEYGVIACSAAIDGDFTSADSYVDQANVFYTQADADQTTINNIQTANAGEFPLEGMSLGSLYEQYYNTLQDDYQDIENYTTVMENIEEENDDFFVE